MIGLTVGMNNQLAVLTFRVGDQTFALPIDYVVEVMAMVESDSINGAKPGIIGIVNRHGTPMPLLDLRIILGKDSSAQVDASTLFIVVQDRARYAGLIVDEIYQVDYVAGVKPPPQGIRFIQGIASDHQSMVQVIAVAAVLADYLPDEVEV